MNEVRLAEGRQLITFYVYLAALHPNLFFSLSLSLSFRQVGFRGSFVCSNIFHMYLKAG